MIRINNAEIDKSTLSISEALKETSHLKTSKDVINDSSKEINGNPPEAITENSNKKHKSSENLKNEKAKEPIKVSSEDSISQNKIMHILQNNESLKPK